MSYTVDEVKELVRRYGNAMGLGHVTRAEGIYQTFDRAMETFRPPGEEPKRRGPRLVILDEKPCADDAPHAPHQWSIKRGQKFRCLGVAAPPFVPAEGPVVSAFLTPVNSHRDYPDLLQCSHGDLSGCDPRGARWYVVKRNAAGEEVGRDPYCMKHGGPVERWINSGADSDK
jgi:hypothetical protein